MPSSCAPGAATATSFDVVTAGPVVHATSVAKSFGSTAVLRDVSTEVPAGVTGLLGSNGAGKTTLISLMLGVEPRNGGDLSVLGHDPATAGPEVRARIGYSPEHHHLPGDVQAADLVRHLAQLHGLPAAASTERASDALWLVGLGEERFRPVGTMSTGQRQRVKLAAAIAHGPELVILDEPTDGLDPVQRDDMLALIRRIGTEYEMSIVLSSHLLEEVERICDHVVILADGVVRHSASLAETHADAAGPAALVIELDIDDTSAIVASLERGGLAVERRDRQLVVQAASEADPVDIHVLVRDAVVRHDAGLVRLVERRTSLEDLFLASSGEGIDFP